MVIVVIMAIFFHKTTYPIVRKTSVINIFPFVPAVDASFVANSPPRFTVLYAFRIDTKTPSNMT